MRRPKKAKRDRVVKLLRYAKASETGVRNPSKGPILF